MTKEEFVKIATRGGYADKNSAEKYAKETNVKRGERDEK